MHEWIQLQQALLDTWVYQSVHTNSLSVASVQVEGGLTYELAYMKRSSTALEPTGTCAVYKYLHTYKLTGIIKYSGLT